jgi:hypothetical protein
MACDNGRCGDKDVKTCPVCGEGLPAPARGKNRKYCSSTCRGKARARSYSCLCCGVEFNRKRYPSGAVSCQKKYCSRECAFEARRRKLPAAQRPLEIASKLANWFLSWHAEATRKITHTTKPCERCGAVSVFKVDAAERVCARCVSVRPCAACGAEVRRPFRFCQRCGPTNSAEKKREIRRRRRKKHGHDCTFRQRCKKYGAVYTNVSKKAVMGRDRWRCKICGVRLLMSYTLIMGTRTPHPRCPTIDHIIPLSLGKAGQGHVFDNCQAACWQCNCLRGATPLHSFVPQYTTSLD